MATNNQNQNGIPITIPNMLSLKDIVTIISLTITLTLAWGVFSTRITVLEREVVSLQDTVKIQAAAIDKLQQRSSNHSARQQDDELLIDQLYSILRRPTPTRRAPSQ